MIRKKITNCNANGYIKSGKEFYHYSAINENNQNSKELYQAIGPSRHFTMIYNLFVLLQIANQINSRKSDKSLNIFEGFRMNSYALAAFICEIIVHVLLIQYGGQYLGFNAHVFL